MIPKCIALKLLIWYFKAKSQSPTLYRVDIGQIKKSNLL